MFVQQMSVYVTKVSYVAGVHYTRACISNISSSVSKCCEKWGTFRKKIIITKKNLIVVVFFSKKCTLF